MGRCSECGGQMAGRRENFRYGLAADWEATVKDVMVHRCGACGNYEVTVEKLSPLHRALVMAVLRKPGRLAAVEVTFLRAHMGIAGRELARTLGVTPQALSTWESGKHPIGEVPDRALRLVVALEPGLAGTVTRVSLAAIGGEEAEPLQLVASLRDGEWTVQSAGTKARTAA
jgi:DNA-binding transcriptional regulator YiaG